MNKILTESRNNYFDYDADIGIIGHGETVETCFTDVAKTMFALMADLSAVNVRQIINFEFQEADLEIALVTWLNLLISKAKTHQLIFTDFRLKRINNNLWQATVSGDTWHKNITRDINVKSATSNMLSVKKINHLWEARIVVDV